MRAISSFTLQCGLLSFSLIYFKAGLLRTASVQPANNSPTTQRASKPAMPQSIQGIKPGVDASKMVAIGSGSYEEDPCVICHEDMNASFDIVTLECGHRYHSGVRILILRFCAEIENRFLKISY